MARTEATLTCCSITQALDVNYWLWSEAEKNAIRADDTKAVGEIIKARLENAGFTVKEMYIIQHNKDVQTGWDEVTLQEVVTYKSHHIHCVVKFGKGGTIAQIAQAVGLEPQFIEKAGKGKYGYDNLLSYLIHIKYLNKHQYDFREVITICGKSYAAVYMERRVAWEKGRAKLQTKESHEGVDWLEEKILSGELTRSEIMLTDDYFNIYARNKRRCEDAFDTLSQRKAYKCMQALERGEFKNTIFYVTGRSHSGKSVFTDRLVAAIQRRVKEITGESWCVCSVAASNPFDDYSGEEILVMDDIRGVALTSSDWLRLLDGDRVNMGSARFHNKMVSARVVIINCEKDIIDFFYYVKNNGGKDRSEAMDQYLRRVLAHVLVYRVPAYDGTASEERRIKIGVMQEMQEYDVVPPDMDALLPLRLHHGFATNPQLENMNYEEALEALVNVVLAQNKLIPNPAAVN